MKQDVEVRFASPESVRKVADKMAEKLPLRQETRRNPGTMMEKRDLELTNGKKIHADIDPVIILPAELY